MKYDGMKLLKTGETKYFINYKDEFEKPYIKGEIVNFYDSKNTETNKFDRGDSYDKSTNDSFFKYNWNSGRRVD